MSDAVLKSWHLERASRERGVLPALGTAGLALALLVGSILGLARALPGAVITPPAPPTLPPRPSWIEIQRPVHVFDLSSPVLGDLPLIYTARRLDPGESRADVLAFGALAGDTPALRLELLRRGPPSLAARPLFAALVREAADVGLSIRRSSLPNVMATRFGTFEVVDIAFAKSAPPGANCRGFRLIVGAPALTMTGLACGSATHPIAHGDLACLLDRLDLASAGDDVALRDFFAATELKRNMACAGMRLGPDGLHAARLDDKPATHRKSLRRR